MFNFGRKYLLNFLFDMKYNKSLHDFHRIFLNLYILRKYHILRGNIFLVFVFCMKYCKIMHDFHTMFLNLYILRNVPRYPGYQGYQLFATVTAKKVNPTYRVAKSWYPRYPGYRGTFLKM